VPLDLEREFSSAINDMTTDEKRNFLHILKSSLNGDKRQRQRKNHKINAQVLQNHHRCDGIIENLSPGGAFLSTNRLFPPGSEITLSFQILNFEFPVLMNAEVVWISDQGMGLKFKPSLKLACRLAAQKIADAMERLTAES
jgi:Tfp pilus assembly protein PilZ